MKDFNYYSPTEVVFGKESEKAIGKLVKNHNEKKEAEKQEIVNQVKTELIEDAIN